jgi:phosphohistidine phosphatase
MNLLMMRHGEAGSAHPMGDDSLRPLTDQGVEKLERQAKQMVKWEIRIDRIVSSPYVRARQTAQIVADAYKLKIVEDDRLSAVNFTLHALGSLLVEHANIKHLLITGHNPDFSTVLGTMIGGATVEFSKGALACIDVARLNPPAGRLVYFVTPELMGA